jgi:hypothetical protein
MASKTDLLLYVSPCGCRQNVELWKSGRASWLLPGSRTCWSCSSPSCTESSNRSRTAPREVACYGPGVLEEPLRGATPCRGRRRTRRRRRSLAREESLKLVRLVPLDLVVEDDAQQSCARRSRTTTSWSPRAHELRAETSHGRVAVGAVVKDICFFTNSLFIFELTVPHGFCSGPTFLAALSFVYFVPSSSVYFSTVGSGGWTVPKNANHSKTCIKQNATNNYVTKLVLLDSWWNIFSSSIWFYKYCYIFA